MSMPSTVRLGLGDSLTVIINNNEKEEEFFPLREDPDLVFNSKLKCEGLAVNLRESNVRIK